MVNVADEERRVSAEDDPAKCEKTLDCPIIYKNETFMWNSCAQESFTKLKKALTHTTVLSFLTEDGKLILDTDASSAGCYRSGTLAEAKWN